MKSVFGLAAATLLASSAVCQGVIALPAPTSTYNGFSRGFAFTAPAQMMIVGLDLPTFAMQAGDTASYAIFLNQVEVFRSVGNVTSAITLNQMVQQGDWVDIVGGWSAATTSNFSSHNAYTAGGGTYSTPVMGTNTVLYRSGWQWDIGDPNYTSGSLTYYPGGGFGYPGTGSMGVIHVDTAPATGIFANFTSDVTTGPSPLTVNFQDTSYTSDPGGILAYAWDFDNDGTIDDATANPTWTYAACGTYDVSLTVFDATGSDTRLATAYITTDVVTADFAEQLIAPLTMQFTDTSIGSPTSWAWDLDGDGVTDATTQTTAWVYPNLLPVQVTLTVSRLCGPTDTITKTIVPAQQLSTGVAANNANGNYGSVMVDLDVLNPAGISISSLDIHTTTAGTVNLDMYVRQGTYDTFWSSPEEWVFVGTATGTTTGGGYTVPENLAFAAPVYLPPGLSGVKFHYRDFYCQYTTGTGVQTFGNADVSMTAGTSQYTTATNAFTGSTITPRWFAGTIYYGTHNLTGLAGYGAYGPGCAGSMGNSALTPSADPVLGSVVTITIDNLPVDTAILMNGFSNSAWPLGPLPYDLTALGAAGCFLRVSPDLTTFLAGTGNSASWTFGIPNAPSLSGLVMYQQAIVFDPGFNTIGAVGSNAYGMLFGM